MKSKLWSIVVALLILAPLGVNAQTDTSALILSLQKQILQLLIQIQTLQKEVTELKSETGIQTFPPISPISPLIPISAEETEPPELTRSLSLGARGDDVQKLQEFLARDREIYPEGLTTGYYGPRTVEAVRRWQKKNNVEAVGTVGPKTIAKFRELGQGVVRGLIQQGTPSGVIPPGLMTAPGIQRQMAPSTSSGQATATPTVMSPMVATTTPVMATTTPAIPAIPAEPATPAIPGATSVIPATPATPATPAQPTTTSTTDTTPPLTPTNLTAVAYISTQINLSWATSTDNVNVAGYKIYRNNAYITSVSSTTHSDQNLTPSTTYTYTVAAYDAAGNVSVQSSPASATTPAAAATPTTAPVISTATGTYSYEANITTDSATINWTTDKPADSQLDWGTWSSGYILKTPLDSSLVTNHSVPLTGLYRSSTYSYRINSRDAAGNLATKSGNFTTMPEISNVRVSNITDHSTTITWDTSEGLNLDTVFYGLDTNYGSTQSRTISSWIQHSIDISGLTAGTTYHFYLKSQNTNVPKYVATSGDYTFTTLLAADSTTTSTALGVSTLPAAPSNLTASPTGPSRITLNWVDNANNELRFVIFSRRPPNIQWSQVGQVQSANATSYNDDSVYNFETRYEYKVLACDSLGCSPDSNYASATAGVPSFITGLVANVSGANVTLTWQDISSIETAIFVYRKNAGATTMPLTATLATNTTSYTDINMAPGTYEYGVATGNQWGSLGLSNSTIITVTVSSTSGGTATTTSAIIDSLGDLLKKLQQLLLPLR